MAGVLRVKAERERQRERQAALRAGLVASAIYNVHRKRGQRALRPSDFVRGERKYMTVEEARRYMDAWAREHNKGIEA